MAGQWRWLFACALLGASVPAIAAINGALEDAGWQELTFDDKSANRYITGDDGEILIDGEGSVSVLWRPLDRVASGAGALSWRWRVDDGTPATDLSQKGGDDRAIALYVSFEFDPDRASFWERSKRALIQPFVADELPGRVLLYVWGGAETSDEWVDNPYFSGVGKMRILRAADSEEGAWFEQSVDLAADHRAAFGEEPTAAYQLAISSDSDDTGSTVRARIADLKFEDQLLR